MITLIVNGDVYTPEPRGRAEVLVFGDTIAKVGSVDRDAVDRLGVDVEVVDAAGCYVVPGLIDPHEHLLGGSGEEGFATQTPEINLSEIVTAGITTVVGALGVDTTMKTMAGLLAKAKALKEEGLNAFVWSGGYSVPPTTVLSGVRDDILYIDEVIGAGEIAISDERATEPEARDLARVATEAHVGGMLSRKAGLTHVHVGDGDRRLAVIRELLESFDVGPEWFYLTHVERSEALMDEAIELAARGATVDVDVHERDLAKWFRYYREHDGDPARLTASSDSGTVGPHTLFDQVRSCVLEHGIVLDEILPIVTSNTARVLALDRKGWVAAGKLADVAVVRRASFELVDVFSRGRGLVRGGRLAASEKFLKTSNRRISLHGEDD
jgi:beta-aspartyl-dipeptidase (metallo-type)